MNIERLYIGGHWRAPINGDVLEIRSPHDQSLVGLAAQAGTADVDAAVADARRAFDDGRWAQLAPEERQEVVARFNKLHAARAEEFAALVTSENGTPLWMTQGLQGALSEQTEAYLRAARAMDWELDGEFPGGARASIRREAIGVVAAVIPWNAPQQSALVKVIPALLVGNSVILKASPETSLDALLLGEVFTEAGFPDGVVSILPADRETSEYLVAHPGVDKIAFTGSTAAGRRIASIAGQQLKRISMELGGKSAAIVLEDADLDAVVQGTRYATFGNNGESCIGHMRILAPRSRYEEVVQAIATLADELTVGDPSDQRNHIGPMVRRDQQERVQNYIRIGIEEGARVAAGGPETPEGLEQGNYVTPTVFADVDNSMRIAQEEIFGPVVAIIAYEDEDDAVRIANDSAYGLHGGVWSADPERALALARRMQTGVVAVNGAPITFDMPFGGFKASGIGREFGAAGLEEYTEVKTITK